jgi:hypothetical protein
MKRYLNEAVSAPICETCEHCDKSAHPKNLMFGKCNYILPTLPQWMHATDAMYRSVSIALSGCPTYSARDAGVKP